MESYLDFSDNNQQKVGNTRELSEVEFLRQALAQEEFSHAEEVSALRHEMAELKKKHEENVANLEAQHHAEINRLKIRLNEIINAKQISQENVMNEQKDEPKEDDATLIPRLTIAKTEALANHEDQIYNLRQDMTEMEFTYQDELDELEELIANGEHINDDIKHLLNIEMWKQKISESQAQYQATTIALHKEIINITEKKQASNEDSPELKKIKIEIAEIELKNANEIKDLKLQMKQREELKVEQLNSLWIKIKEANLVDQSVQNASDESLKLRQTYANEDYQHSEEICLLRQQILQSLAQ